MGGIMASSEPLIQEVAKFNKGADVYVPPQWLGSSAFGKNIYDAIVGNKFIERVLPPNVKRVETTKELGPKSRTESGAAGFKNLPGGGLETDWQKLGRGIKGAWQTGWGMVGDVGESVLDVLPSGNLTDASLLKIMEGYKNSEGKLVFPDSDEYAGRDLIKEIKESGLPIAKKRELLNLPPGATIEILDEPAGQIIQYGPGATTKTGDFRGPYEIRKKEERIADLQGGLPFAGPEANKEEIIKALEKAKTVGTPEGTTAAEREAFKAEDTKEIRNEQDQSAMYDAAELSKQVKEGNASEEDIKNQVQNTVKSGAGVGGSLQQLMKEFTSNAPKDKGMDRGLAIAKIGFAMAAGESPNAITNIAKALEQGADMFIKDDEERRKFNRQVELAALQYGLGEISKQRTQARSDARNFMKFVTTKEMTYKGTKYEKGDDVLVSMADLIANDGKIPSGLRDQALHLKLTQAVIDREKLFAKQKEDLRKELLISDEQGTKLSTQYADAASKFKSADTGIAYFEQALDILAKEDLEGFFKGGATGGAGFLKNVKYKTGNFLGIELGKKYDLDDVEQLKRLFAQGLQPLIKVTLGETQSANSISNRDVEFLIKAFFGDRALEEGVFNFAFADADEMAARVQAAMGEMRRAQIGNLNTMDTLERRLRGRILPGEGPGSALGLIEEDFKDVAPYLPGATNQMNPGGFAEIFDTGETQGGIRVFRARGLT
tara:strand:+ start:29 stop:2182 length:2154 start_codon:yes stop_codon:yes gene_type:complete